VPTSPTIRLLGVRVDALTLDEASRRIATEAAAGRGGWAVTPNLDILRRATRDAEFRELYDATTMKLADGMPLVWASRLQRTPLPERAAGSDLIWKLAEHAAECGASIFLLGGNPGTAEKSVAALTARFPKLRIAGIECPPPGFDKDPASLNALIDRVSAASPGIVLVALGCPKQEHVINHLRPRMPAAWFIGVGITFSFVAGEVRRAPAWMRKVGLEWTHRLIQEPRRLVKRYLVDGVPFAVWLLSRSAITGLFGGSHRRSAESSTLKCERL
jgi:N-acetylglucosaminyldiphosphoundecaprenol N-acetyl-beta-D-mannosaminyltransferase